MPPKKIAPKKLFGQVQRPIPTGNHQPDISELQETAQMPEAVLPIFCQGCGYLAGLLPAGIPDVQIEIPSNCQNLYIQVELCPCCSNDGLKNPTLKKISDVK